MSKFYAGIGSRETPKDMIKNIGKVVRYLNKRGYILRSGGANGADLFFEQNLDRVSDESNKEIYLPWANFNKNKSKLYHLTDDAFELAKKYHPNWDKLSDAGKKLMARNGYDKCTLIILKNREKMMKNLIKK